MWIIEVPSEGDLTNDNYHIIHDPESSYADSFGNRPRFMDSFDIKIRRDLVIDSIHRLAAELEFLNDTPELELYDFEAKYLSYEDVEFPE